MFKYTEILQAMAERAKVSDTPWDVIQYKFGSAWYLCDKFPLFEPSGELRIKPKTIKVGNREVSEPLTLEDLKRADGYYYPCFKSEYLAGYKEFYNTHEDRFYTKHKLARRTEAEAIELAEALLEILSGGNTET